LETAVSERQPDVRNEDTVNQKMQGKAKIFEKWRFSAESTYTVSTQAKITINNTMKAVV
jgi:hypothetical protein